MNKIYGGKAKNKWFDGDCLPYRKGKGGKENSIDWANSVGSIVEFECCGYHGFYTILDRFPNPNNTTSNKQLDFLYKICIDNDKERIFTVNQRMLRTVNLAYLLGIYSSEFLYDVGDVIKGKFLVLKKERKKFYQKDKGKVRVYTCKCLLDDYVFEMPEYMIERQSMCPLCASTVVVSGVNDIATLRPELVKFLVDKNDAYKYYANTHIPLNFKCDVCGKEFQSSLTYFSMSFPCGCYSSKSYPNRFIEELFRQIKVPFISELRKCHFDWCGRYRYDLYFEHNNQGYIVEMDGGQHKKEKQRRIDEKKTELAERNNVKVIRIDCDYKNGNKRFTYIRDNVVDSILSNIFDLSNVNWTDINTKILTTNNSKEIWRLKNLGYVNREISSLLDISISKVGRIVRHGCEIGEVEPFLQSNTNAYSKVMVVVNLETMKKEYYIGLKDFYNKSEKYVGFKMSDGIFKTNEKDGHSVINGYDMTKISYMDYIKETAN